MNTWTKLEASHAVEWPYPVNYGRENEVSCDILILGGGVAGCRLPTTGRL